MPRTSCRPTLLRTARDGARRRQQPEAYARRVLVNLAKDRWRTLCRRPAEVAVVTRHRRTEDARAEETPCSTVIVLLAAIRSCRRAARRARAAVLRRPVSVEDTAAALGCSDGTVKSQTSRALDRLRPALDPDRRSPPMLTDDELTTELRAAFRGATDDLAVRRKVPGLRRPLVDRRPLVATAAVVAALAVVSANTPGRPRPSRTRAEQPGTCASEAGDPTRSRWSATRSPTGTRSARSGPTTSTGCSTASAARTTRSRSTPPGVQAWVGTDPASGDHGVWVEATDPQRWQALRGAVVDVDHRPACGPLLQRLAEPDQVTLSRSGHRLGASALAICFLTNRIAGRGAILMASSSAGRPGRRRCAACSSRAPRP